MGQGYFTQQIYEYWLPAAIRYGIDMRTFGNLNPRIMYAYQDAYIEQKKQDIRLLDVAAFYNGLYVQQAVASCFSKRAKYPKQPLSFAEKAKSLSGVEQFKLWVQEYNKRFNGK